jgi:murein L,D-transpeptidase YcbB/YkuD
MKGKEKIFNRAKRRRSMLQRIFVFLFTALVLAAVSGCATTRKSSDLEMQGLKNQMQGLESEVQQKDREIGSLREALSRVTEEKAALRRQAGDIQESSEVKSRPSMKQIQTALKNAGFDPGPIDGRKGKQTKEAVKAFQKANNLAVDGKVGKQTWILLGQYLEKKQK